MAKNTPGLLISFEGGEGGGKSTQVQILAERLRQKGVKVQTFREPGGTEIGEAIRNIVLNPSYKEMAFTTEVMLFQAQRAQLYHQLILPALQEKQIILLDRSRDSSLVYQGMVRGFGKELLDELNTISTQDTYPNITFLLDVSVDFGLQRRAETNKTDRLDQESLEFHQQVREAYLELAKENTEKRWQIIDANQSTDKVAEHIWETLTTLSPDLQNFTI